MEQEQAIYFAPDNNETLTTSWYNNDTGTHGEVFVALFLWEVVIVEQFYLN